MYPVTGCHLLPTLLPGATYNLPHHRVPPIISPFPGASYHYVTLLPRATYFYITLLPAACCFLAHYRVPPLISVLPGATYYFIGLLPGAYCY